MSKAIDEFFDCLPGLLVFGGLIWFVVWSIKATNARHERACEVWRKCLIEKKEYECVGLLGDYAESCRVAPPKQ